jgi:hypothetical protein
VREKIDKGGGRKAGFILRPKGFLEEIRGKVD